jgi:hypothetical protein
MSKHNFCFETEGVFKTCKSFVKNTHWCRWNLSSCSWIPKFNFQCTLVGSTTWSHVCRHSKNFLESCARQRSPHSTWLRQTGPHITQMWASYLGFAIFCFWLKSTNSSYNPFSNSKWSTMIEVCCMFAIVWTCVKLSQECTKFVRRLCAKSIWEVEPQQACMYSHCQIEWTQLPGSRRRCSRHVTW